MSWVLTLGFCVIFGAIVLMMDRRWGMRTIRFTKSQLQKDPITDDLAYGFISGQRPTVRMVIAVGLAIALWQLFGVLALYDVWAGAIAIFIGFMLEPVAEIVMNRVLPFTRKFDEGIASLEKGEVDVSSATSSVWEKMRKSWATKPPAPSPVQPAPSPATVAPAPTESTPPPAAPATQPVEGRDEKARKAYEEFRRGS